MPTSEKRLTDALVDRLEAPAEGYAIFWFPKTQPGLGVRVSATARAFVLDRRVNGKSVRRVLGAASGRGRINVDAAIKLAVDVSSGLQRGTDPAEVRREERAARAAAKAEEQRDALTLADAIDAYCRDKRRAKDGKPLKARTQADYMDMVAPATERRAAGTLHTLAAVPLHRITAEQIRALHTTLHRVSPRQADYAMATLRAVLRWNGVTIADNPLSMTTAGAQRIHLAPPRPNPKPIPGDKVGAWWRAAAAHAGNPGADGYRFQLLTGLRPGEVFGSDHEPGLQIADVDLERGTATVSDPKNRQQHVVLLSMQAQAIVAAHIGTRKRGPVFKVRDAGKTLKTINATAGTEGVTPQRLRHTFATLAEPRVSAFTLKALINHTPTAAADGATGHYVRPDDLRAAWQRIADHIEEQAAPVR